MTEPTAREGLLKHLKFLRKQRRYAEIERLLKELPRSVLERDGELCLYLANTLSMMHRYDEAKSILLEVEAEIAGSGNSRLLSRWQYLRGAQLMFEGNLIPAERLLLESLAVAERHSDLRLIGEINMSLGVIESFRGEVEQAICYFNRTLLAWQSLGEPHAVGMAYFNLGLILRLWGQATEAMPHFDDAEEYIMTNGTYEETVMIRAARAQVFNDLGDLPLAEQLARSAVADSSTIASDYVRADALLALGCVLARARKYEEAESCLLAGLGLVGGSSVGILRAEILEELAMVNLLLARDSEAQARYEEASAEYGRLGSINNDRRLHLRYSAALAGS